MELRDYQREAIEALENFLKERDDNPCIVLPTGSGKSYVMAEIIRRRIVANPLFRCIVLAHRQELVQQNHKEFVELMGVTSGNLAGIYCSGLGKRDVTAQVIFANIQSVHGKAADFPCFDMILVDEAHHIPVRNNGEDEKDGNDNGRYRGFIKAAQNLNRSLRVVGLTATPYRLDVGYVCHKDYVLNEVCYEANVRDLIDKGYLSKLRSKISKKKSPDLSNVPKCAGEYKIDELSSCVRKSNLVHNAIRDALDRLDAENRKHCIWFCVDVEHCKMVRDALIGNGQDVAMVTGDTAQAEREKIIEQFRNGELRHLLNVEVFTEGFNVKQVDAIVLLRPTLSRGLYSQMVGRGLRKHPDKGDCIVLDYARCILRHGPIDQELDKFVPLEVCPQCEELFARESKQCPKCGYVVPDEVREQHDKGDERKKRVRELHDQTAALDEILAREHDCGRTLRVVNEHRWLIEGWLLTFAYRMARGDAKYDSKNFRNGASLIDEFVKYAQYVELTNLPEMMKHYLEYDGWHHHEMKMFENEERRIENAKWNRNLALPGGPIGDETKCRHCGSVDYGGNCTGPRKIHEHMGNEKYCEWCGSSEYGRICIHSPYYVHRHGHGANKCIWCGWTEDDGRCSYSPTGHHEK